MLQIVDVEYKGQFSLELSFNNGEKGVVDFEKNLNGSFYGSLKENNLFIQFGLINGTLEWVNGADFAPEFLYDLMLKQQTLSAEKIN